MHHQHAVDHDPDMPLPKHEITACEAIEIVQQRNGLAEFGLLHIGIARRRDACCEQRRLHQS
jgi:hypothetical protein